MAQQISLRKFKKSPKDPVFALQPGKIKKKVCDLGCHYGLAKEFEKINKMQKDPVVTLQPGKT
jgi:hypothetical protein